MNIKGLRAFYLVVTKGSVAYAADLLCLSQPAVSRLISVLETELKIVLFDRTKRQLQLTQEGQLFYREARRILESFDEIPQIANEIKQQALRRLRIVAMPRLITGLVAPVVAAFSQEYPQVKCALDSLSRREMESWLSTKRYDVAIATLPVSHSAIYTEKLFSISAEVLLPRNHPLTQKAQIEAADLQGEPMIGLLPGLLLRQQVDDIFHAAGLDIHYKIETSSSLAACQIVRNGGGITIIDRLSIQGMDHSDMVLRPLSPARFMTFGLLFPLGDSRNKQTQQFIDQLHLYLETLQTQWGGIIELEEKSVK